MNFDDFKNDASNVLWSSASEWLKATIPKPPGTPQAAPVQAPAPVVTVVAPSIDTGTIMKYAGIALAGLAVVFFVTRKKGGRR